MVTESVGGQVVFAVALIAASRSRTPVRAQAIALCRTTPGAGRSSFASGARGTRLLVLLLALSALPAAVSAQVVRYGVIMDAPMSHLDSSWSYNAQQVERAYCISNYSVSVRHVSRKEPIQDDSVFRVWAVEPAATSHASPSSVDFECPDGVPELHVHTPSTCSGEDVRTCVAGGLNAFSCQPSRQDLEKLARRNDPFAVIQCDRRSFRFYYPTEYVAAPAQQLAAAASSAKPDANVPLAMKKETKRQP